MSQSSVSLILNQNKLIGDNLNDWKMNLIIVISFKKHKYILERLCSHVPLENAYNAELMAYAKWLYSNEIDHCYMMASMNS